MVRNKHQKEEVLMVENHDYMHDMVVFAAIDLSLNECDVEKKKYTCVIPMIRICYL